MSQKPRKVPLALVCVLLALYTDSPWLGELFLPRSDETVTGVPHSLLLEETR